MGRKVTKEIPVPNRRSRIGKEGRESPWFAPALQASEGFTLLEVLVALAILSVSLAVLLAAFSQGLSYARENATEADARALAQSLVAQALTTPNPAFGDTEGQSAAMHWSVHIVPYGAGDDQVAWQKRAQQISATISWANSGRTRSISLTTLRLAQGTVPQ
jgi:general secretion pathway protein I